MNDRKAYELARIDGGAARRGGRKRTENPFRGYTKQMRDRHYAWDLGWLAADTEIKAKKR